MHILLLYIETIICTLKGVWGGSLTGNLSEFQTISTKKEQLHFKFHNFIKGTEKKNVSSETKGFTLDVVECFQAAMGDKILKLLKLVVRVIYSQQLCLKVLSLAL